MSSRRRSGQSTNPIAARPPDENNDESAHSRKTNSNKKRKSSTQDITPSEVAVEEVLTASEQVEQRPSKKKKGKDAAAAAEEGNVTSLDQRPADNVVVEIVVSQPTANGTGQGAKMKKEAKGKEKATAEAQQESLPVELQQSTLDAVPNAALLSALASAVLAAANSNSEGHQPSALPQSQSQVPNLNIHPFSAVPGQPDVTPSSLPPMDVLQHLMPSGSTDPNFADLQNNEEMLRALQVLRALGDSAAQQDQASTSAAPSQQAMQPPPMLPFPNTGNPHPICQMPVPSALILGQPMRNPPIAPPGLTTTAVSMPIAGTEQNPEHARLLCSKWLSAAKLGELIKTKGLVYKKGKFSTTEEEQVKASIENYRRRHELSFDQINDKIFAKGPKSKDSEFWAEITSQVPQRPIISVYHYVRRAFHPMKGQGKWMPAEDATLKQAVLEHGQSWAKVSTIVGRMEGDCRDRWRNYVSTIETRTTGHWTLEEEGRLTKIVTDMTLAQGKDPDNDVFWTQVAAAMGNTRGRQQCRIKWTDSLSKMLKNAGTRPRWSPQDAYILVHKIASLNVRDDTEIDWKLLVDGDWNIWSPHSLQRRWLSLKRSVRGHEEMTHQEIMDILRLKKAHIPTMPAAPRKSRVTSARMVPVDVQLAEAEQVAPLMPQAGPSNYNVGYCDEDIGSVAAGVDLPSAVTPVPPPVFAYPGDEDHMGPLGVGEHMGNGMSYEAVGDGGEQEVRSSSEESSSSEDDSSSSPSSSSSSSDEDSSADSDSD